MAVVDCSWIRLLGTSKTFSVDAACCAIVWRSFGDHDDTNEEAAGTIVA